MLKFFCWHVVFSGTFFAYKEICLFEEFFSIFISFGKTGT